MNRIKELNEEVNRIIKESIRKKMPSPKIMSAEICYNLKESQFTWAWERISYVSGLENKLIADLGLTKCKKNEANILMIIGEKTPEGCYIIGKHKNYWLKNVHI